MVSILNVEEQLRKIGFRSHGWGKGEIRELSKVLSDDEIILQCVNGYYQNGFAMLVATNQRLVLVDSKPMFLTLEAIWYDKIGQLDYNHRLLNSTICISSPNKDLQFTSMNQPRLRQILAYAQERMMASRGINPIYAVQGNQNNIPQFAYPYNNSVYSVPNTPNVPVNDPLATVVQQQPNDTTRQGTNLHFTRPRYFSRDV